MLLANSAFGATSGSGPPHFAGGLWSMDTTFLTSGTRKPGARLAVHATYLDIHPHSAKARQAATSCPTSHPRRDATVYSTPLSNRDKPCRVPACRWCHTGRNGLWEVTANVPPWFNSTGPFSCLPSTSYLHAKLARRAFFRPTFLNIFHIATFLNTVSRAFAEVSTRPTL